MAAKFTVSVEPHDILPKRGTIVIRRYDGVKEQCDFASLKFGKQFLASIRAKKVTVLP